MFDADNLQVIMAGSGNPYNFLNKRRLQIIHALHEAYDLPRIQMELLHVWAVRHRRRTQHGARNVGSCSA